MQINLRWVYSLFIVCCCPHCVSMFYDVVPCALSSLTIILLRKRELVALLKVCRSRLCFVTSLQGGMGWSAVCDCGISWSCSLTFCYELKLQWQHYLINHSKKEYQNVVFFLLFFGGIVAGYFFPITSWPGNICVCPTSLVHSFRSSERGIGNASATFAYRIQWVQSPQSSWFCLKSSRHIDALFG